MEQEWTITEYDFYFFRRIRRKKKRPAIFVYIHGSGYIWRRQTDAAYRFSAPFPGGDYFRMNEMPDIVAVPLAYYNVEEDDYAYKLVFW